MPPGETSRATDREMVARLQAGDAAALQELISAHWDRVFTRAFVLLKSKEDAEEVAQDTFLRAHRNIHTFRGDAALSTWLYQIATNLAHNRYWYWLRRRRNHSHSLDQEIASPDDPHPGAWHEKLADSREGPREEAMRDELSSRVEKCLPTLSRQHREILHLRLHRGLAYEEIAAELGLHVGTVKSRLARARQVLKDALGPDFH